MALDEVVADGDAIAIRVGCLDDGARVLTARFWNGQIHRDRRADGVPLSVADNLHNRPGERFGVGVCRRNDGQLESIEYDECSNRIDPEKIDERFYKHGVEPAARIVAHLFEHCRWREWLG